MYSETITLFNRYHSRLGDIWYPHILHNVDLIVDRASVLAKYGLETADRAKLHVKYGNGLKIENKQYLPSKEWNNLTNDKLADYITFNADANYFDFFMVGEYKDTEPINDDDYMDGFYAEMESKTECYAITSVSSPYTVIPHFEIMAR